MGLFVYSYTYAAPVVAPIAQLTPETPPIASTTPVVINRDPLLAKIAIQKRFGTSTPMLAIAQCESKMRQFLPSGEVLVSPTHDYGLFQINHIHIEEAKKLGIDIMTFEGNIDFAEYLYNQSNVKSWYMSQHCWSTIKDV